MELTEKQIKEVKFWLQRVAEEKNNELIKLNKEIINDFYISTNFENYRAEIKKEVINDLMKSLEKYFGVTKDNGIKEVLKEMRTFK